MESGSKKQGKICAQILIFRRVCERGFISWGTNANSQHKVLKFITFASKGLRQHLFRV